MGARLRLGFFLSALGLGVAVAVAVGVAVGVLVGSVLAAVILGRQIGGNLPRVLESTASSIREMSRLEGVLRTKTSEAKMQLYVIGAAPFVLVLALSQMSPGYFDPLQQSPLGYAIGLGAIGSWLLALYLARQVLSVSL